jgi:hypothetical protein
MNITRTAAIAAAAGVALLAAGCGGSPASSANSAGTASAAVNSDYQKAVAYSQCMRAHGVPSFPDPDSKGRIMITGSGSGQGAPGSSPGAGQAGPGSPAFRSADNSCKHLRPSGGPSGQGNQLAAQQMLKFAQCMRSHGVPNFPDPVISGGGVQLKLTGINPSSPQFKSAQRACQSLAPGGAPPGPPGGTGNAGTSGSGAAGSQP